MAANIEINNINGVPTASFAENGRKERAWHRLGQVFDRPMTVKEALEASHADYEVKMFPLVALTPDLADHLSDNNYSMMYFQDEVLDAIVPNKKVTVRMDTMKPLGVVGDGYGIVQNLDAFTFIDTLCTGQVGDHVPVIECAGVLGRGERVFITAKFPDDIILDNKGDDKVEMYMVFTTSHDGTGAVKCICCPTRVVCANTLRIAEGHNFGCLSLRHSSNVMQRLDLMSKENTEFAFKSMNLMNVYRRSLEERFNLLRRISLTEKEVDLILAKVALSEKDARIFRESGSIDADEIATAGRKQFIALKMAVEQGVGQEYGLRGTGLWLINGITTFYQNHASFKNDEVKFNSILNGYTAKKVINASLALVNG